MDTDLKNKIINAVKDDSTEFCIIPTPSLRELLAKDEHPFIKELPASVKTSMLSMAEGQGIGPLSKGLVLKYIFGELDERHKFLFDRCTVHAVGMHGVTKRPEIEN